MGTARPDRRGPLGLALGLGAALLVVVPSQDAAADVPSDPNPEIEQSCGLDLTLVLDASGSVNSSHAVDDVRDAAGTLLEALSNTNSTARVTQFASLSELLSGRTQIDDASLDRNGPLGQAVTDYYNPIPPRPGSVTIQSYDGSGDPLSSGNYRTANSSNQYTNWDQGLSDAGDDPGELVVFVTDGDPTGFDFDRGSDPFDQGPPPDVAVNTDRSSSAQEVTLDRAIEESNAIKGTGARVLSIGVGSALSNSASVARLQEISGPQVVRDADLAGVEDLNEIDVALITDFEDLSAFFRSLVLELCSPSLTVRKLAQTADDAAYTPQQGRDITVTPSVPGGSGFSWILPDTAPAASKTEPTDGNGFAQFQWEPIPPEADSTALVEEATDPSYDPGRPGADNDYRCELRNEFGDVREVTGDFTDPDNPSFELDPIEQEIVTCTIWNSFDYNPEIALEKSNAPPRVRGDLTPPTTVTSSYVVTNPGDTPLDVTGLTDDQCADVTPVPATGPNTGDTDTDGLLDPGEEWEFTCDRSIVSTTPETIVNTAEVTGIATNGEVVTDQAQDDVDVFAPAVELVKTVDGQDAVTVLAGTEVTYRYEATNTGSMPLGSVTLDDDTPPCESPTRQADAPGNDDAVLDVDETWVWTCPATPEEDVVNTATVEGTPLDPVDGTPFPPDVSDSDPASVAVVHPDLDLAKSVTPSQVLLRDGDPPAVVDYTFEATNGGDDPLVRPGGADPTAPGWVEDDRCLSPAEYVSGDDGDDLFEPGETWTFTCQGEVSATTINTATITGLPADADGDPIPGADPLDDVARALVRVQRPAIEVLKTAVTPVVLDPGAEPFQGPDTPTPRPASYLYEVVNQGTVPLSLDPDPPVDDTCAPLVYTGGDANDDGLLDPDEVWDYTCETPLEREQSDPPPTGAQSGLVENVVDVTGVPFFDGALVPDKSVSDSDEEDVLVIEPSLELTKTASADVVREGRRVEYTIEVENTGDVDLAPAPPTDDKCAPLEFQGGDTDGDGRIDGANSTPEVWTWTCSRPAVAPTPPDLTDVNTASIVAVDPLGNSYRDSDTAEVRVLSPAINVVKTPRKLLVPVGTPVTFDFEVTNAGTSPIAEEDVLEQVRLLDVSEPALPECDGLTPVAKEGGNQDDLLERDPAEVWRYECTAPIEQLTVNVAIVAAIGGRPVDLTFPVLDFDPAFVGAFDPEIAIEKTASPTELEGSGEVTYTYEVTNTGNVPLADVADRIADDTCDPVEFVDGDTDGDGLLDTPTSIFEDAAPEVWTFECTAVVDEDTVNVATVTGSPVGPEGAPLCGPDVDPAILVTEPCDVDATDRAKVVVTPERPPVDPGGGGGNPPTSTGTTTAASTGTPVLPDTGAGRWLLVALLAGVASLLGGAGLVGSGVRRRRAELLGP